MPQRYSDFQFSRPMPHTDQAVLCSPLVGTEQRCQGLIASSWGTFWGTTGMWYSIDETCRAGCRAYCHVGATEARWRFLALFSPWDTRHFV